MLRSVGPVVAALLLMCTEAVAQPSPPDPNPQALPTITLPPVEVIGTTPLPGTGIDRDKVPANVQSLTAVDLAREGSPSLTNSLTGQAGGVNVNATLDDSFQPDILFRFAADAATAGRYGSQWTIWSGRSGAGVNSCCCVARRHRPASISSSPRTARPGRSRSRTWTASGPFRATWKPF